MGVSPCETLAHYQNDGLESAADELAHIWFNVNAHSSVFKEVAKSTPTSDPADSGSKENRIYVGAVRMSLRIQLKIVWAR